MLEEIDDEYEEPKSKNEEGIIICNKMWEIYTVAGMWLYSDDECKICDGFNKLCKHYDPID
ncbi:MAG: hypothetical protein V1889_00050 [archaeon]